MDDFDDRFLDTDINGVLKIPFVLWLGLIIHTRHWFLTLLTFVSIAVGATNTTFSLELKNYLAMIAIQTPSLLVLIAGSLRQPAAQKWVRVVWKNGSWLMAITASLNLVYVTGWLFVNTEWNRWPELYLVSTALLDLAIAYWAMSQALPRQVFSEFPTSRAN